MPETVDDNMASQVETEQADEAGQVTAVQLADNSRDPTPSANTRRKQDRERMVKNCIDEALTSNGPILELNNLEISKIPENLLKLGNVQVCMNSAVVTVWKCCHSLNSFGIYPVTLVDNLL